jgi:hypothetical protein
MTFPTDLGSSRGEGVSWYTVYVIFFHIFSVFDELNVRARMGRNTLGLQFDLHKLHAIYNE